MALDLKSMEMLRELRDDFETRLAKEEASAAALEQRGFPTGGAALVASQATITTLLQILQAIDNKLPHKFVMHAFSGSDTDDRASLQCQSCGMPVTLTTPTGVDRRPFIDALSEAHQNAYNAA